MPTKQSPYKAIERNGDTTAGDQTAHESHVPPALAQLFERPTSEQPPPKPLDVFQPADWPPCPDCADRLLAVAVATDAHDTLVAATMTCYNREHAIKRYVYDVVTETIYFDQICAAPATEPTDG